MSEKEILNKTISNNLTQFLNEVNSKHYKFADIHNINIPLVVSYENDINNNENSQTFEKTLNNCNWEYIFIGEGLKWNGSIDKIMGYYNFLKKMPEEKIVILSDARDVFCVRSPLTFMNHIKNIIEMNKIIVSAEMYLIGHMDWNDEKVKKAISKEPNFFWQGLPLKNYWSFYNKNENMPFRKYVNSGLIIGKVKHLMNAFKWMIDNKYTDDQLGLASYINKFPYLIELDYNATFLHTSTFGSNGGLYSIEIQKLDSPTFSELLGVSSYFLHIPGINISKGQKMIYGSIRDILESKFLKLKNCELFKLYNLAPQSDLNYKYIINNDNI